MDEITKEIKQEAEKMTKSQVEEVAQGKNAETRVIESLVILGEEGIRQHLSKLSKSEKETLLTILPKVSEVIQKGKKSVTVDEGEKAKFHVGDVYGTGADGKNGKGTIIQEDKADDDIDETLVKPEAAGHSHQGDHSPQGLDDYEISDPKKKEKKEKKVMKKSEFDSEKVFEQINELVSKGDSELQVSAQVLQKGYDLDTLNVVGDMIQFAIAENNRRMDMDTDCPMYKDLSKMHRGGMSKDYMKGYGMAKGGMGESEISKMIAHVVGEKDMKKSTEDSVKGGNMQGIKPNPEEVQVKDDLESLREGVVRGEQSRPEGLKVDSENVSAQKKVDVLNQGQAIQKAVPWSEKNLFATGTGGRNYNFSMNDMYDSVLGNLDAKLEKAEVAADSTTDAGIIHDLIEKGEDLTACDYFVKKGLGQQDSAQARLREASFDLSDIGNALRVSEEDMKKI